MLTRCLNPRHSNYDKYGGAGITVCQAWRVFDNFLADMGVRPVGHSLDRINNSGNYEPGNCRWATARQQCRNRSSNHIVEFRGEHMPISDLAERVGISKDLLLGRLGRGWNVERAATTPIPHVARAIVKANVKLRRVGRSEVA